MYIDFFKLKLDPFAITPDPRFLFPSNRHKEALAALYYGVHQRKGFVVLTGEVGTGKTLLIRCLLELLRDKRIACAYIFNSSLSTMQFLQGVASDLGIPAAGQTKIKILRDLNHYLLARYRRRLTTVLVVDEAHHLSTEILEEIRLLTNLESPDEKLLQIVLVGQSELSDKLDSYELRQLKQRIALRAYLEPLDLENTKGYIRCRLQCAGANSHAGSLIPDDTAARIFHFSRGIPRLINTISDNALVTAFARHLEVVAPSIIDEVADDLRIHMGKLRSLSVFETNKGTDASIVVGPGRPSPVPPT